MSGQISFTIIGSGNVSHSLVPAILKVGYTIDTVISRKEASAKTLAEKYNLRWSTNLKDVGSDVIIISVPDDNIEKIAAQIKPKTDTIVLHTAGSVSIEAIKKHHANAGILYPLQTFSKNRIINFNKVPICIEASSKSVQEKLSSIAGKLSQLVYELNSDERKIAHLSAVFVCNFVNLMYTSGYDIMQKNQLSFDILKPLIMETARKAMDKNPDKLQTGPALRGDTATLHKHMSMLDENMAEIYNFLSQSITNRFN